MANKAVAMLVAVSSLVVLVATMSAGGASADQCNIARLAVCKPAVINGAKPTPACCSNLRAQEACLCKYQNDPKFGRYINENARKMVTSCGMAIPNC